MNVTKVIVPMGVSRVAERVMPVAAEVSEVLDAPIEIVHVLPSLDVAPHIARRRDWMTPLAEDFDATLRWVEHAKISDGLRDVMSDQPDAIVCMHVESNGGPLYAWLGSTSENILRSSHHRCVLVGPNVRTEPSVADGPVVVCVDGSDHSESILPDAAAWAAAAENPIWVVNVADGTRASTDVDESSYVQGVVGDLGVPSTEWEVLGGRDHAQSIVDFAESRGAGSIVMATHGRSGIDRVALGSTTMRVVNRAPCPVITRRPQALSSIIV